MTRAYARKLNTAFSERPVPFDRPAVQIELLQQFIKFLNKIQPTTRDTGK